jgi:hypothetical protein
LRFLSDGPGFAAVKASGLQASSIPRTDPLLFRNEILNGNDPAPKDFARATLPKIVDHLDGR